MSASSLIPLAFDDKATETRFQREVVRTITPTQRVGFQLGVLIFVVFIYFDYKFLTDATEAATIRLVAAAGILSLVSVASRLPGFVLNGFLGTAAATIASGVISFLIWREGNSEHIYFAGYLIVFAAAPVVASLTFSGTLFLSIFTLIFYTAATVPHIPGLSLSAGYLANSAFVVAGGFAACVSAYIQETARRERFSAEFKLRMESEAFSEINKHLSEAKNSIKQNDERKLAMLNIVSHTQTTQIMHVIQFAELVMYDTDTQLSNEAKSYIDEVLSAGRAIDSQSKRLTRYARIFGGAEEVFARRTSIGRLVSEASSCLTGQDAEDYFVVEYDEGLSEDQELFVDTRLFVFALEELIQNANDAISKRVEKNLITDVAQSYQGQIRLRLSQENDDIVFSLHDNGTGCEAEELNKHVVDFTSLTDYLSFSGTKIPLGLRFVTQIVDRHGGKVEFFPSDEEFEVLVKLPRNSLPH